MFSSDFSEQSSENSEFYSEARRQSGGLMSSVAPAQTLTRDLGEILAPGEKWKGQVSAVHRALTSPSFHHSLRSLTWSRVKSWFYAEARRVDYNEVIALQELKALEEARRAKLKLAATANLLAIHLAAEGTPLDSRQMRALSRLAGQMDSAGTGGA